MKQRRFIIVVFCLLAIGCAQTSVIMLDDSRKFAPSNNVRILEQLPEELFEIIARMETRGTVNQGIPTLLNQMRKEAKKIGADAIIPVEEKQERQQQGFLYNPWLGGYQTIGGGNVPIVTSYAIIFKKSIPQRLAAYRPDPIVNAGISFNALTPILGGYGFCAWVGKNRFRAAFDYYALDTPQAMLRDGFTDGKVETALRASFDYFFLGDLSGPYLGSGFQFGSYSVGHENTSQRGTWDTIDFTVSFGYKLNMSPNLHLDSRIAIDATLFGEEDILVGNNRFEPDAGKLYALIGLGLHF